MIINVTAAVRGFSRLLFPGVQMDYRSIVILNGLWK